MPGHRLRDRRLSLALLGAATSGLVAGAFFVGQQVGGSRRPAAPSATGADGNRTGAGGDVEQEVRLLKARLHALERRPAAPAAAEVPGPTGSEGPAAAELAAGGPASEPRPADDEDRRRYFLAIEDRLAAEPRDPRWADPLEEKLRRLGEDLAGQVTVLSARCSRSLCRAELRRPPGAAALTRELARQAAAVLPEVLLRSTDDPARVVLYLQPEEGENFPPLTARADNED